MLDLNDEPLGIIKQTGRNVSSDVSPRCPETLPKDSVKLRLSTFLTYPKHLRPKPKDLAQAGFLYTGIDDKVICFSCGVGLSDWEPDDDPWTEHRKFSSKCSFIKNDGVSGFFKVTGQTEEIKAKKEQTIPDNCLCVVCRERIRNVLSLPCRHLATCPECNDKLDSCVICRKEEQYRIIINFP